jgi:hypothetical protein
MSIVAPSVPPSQPPAKRRRHQPTHFRLNFLCEDDCYAIWPVPVDPGVGRAAWRFSKRTGDRAVYYVLDGLEGWTCECPGFLRWGNSHGPCKHILMVQAARRTFCGGSNHA